MSFSRRHPDRPPPALAADSAPLTGVQTESAITIPKQNLKRVCFILAHDQVEFAVIVEVASRGGIREREIEIG